MKDRQYLGKLLKGIDRKGYKAYKELRGSYDFYDYTLVIDHVQGDPFAAPSRIRVCVPQGVAQFPSDTYQNRSREIALRDFLARRFSDATKRFSSGVRGSGKSGLIFIDRPGQEILERTAVIMNSDSVETRFRIGLPAQGRTIAGREAEVMFFEELPNIVRTSLIYRNLDDRSLDKHIETAEDADCLREMLDQLDCIAFIPDGAILPRKSGVDPRPLTEGSAIPFVSPQSLKREIGLPNRGRVSGMGIRKGITLIVGGGYHGKSTLLKALERGIYNHIPGDGRELVVASPLSVKIRAEDGRRIEKVDISPFITNLPFGQSTVDFATEDASGSTSQAANIMEAIEIGGEVILIDEDTSATNFMIRDRRIQELVAKEQEPITPFIDKVKQLNRDLGVSTVLVIGGSGDYFDVADTVICMIGYRPHDVTGEAHAIAERNRADRKPEGGEQFGTVTERIPIVHSFDPSRGKRDVKISPKGLQSIHYGVHHIDLGAVEQLVDMSQTRAIGDAIHYATQYMNSMRVLKEVIRCVMDDIITKGLDVISPYPAGDHAAFRPIELAAAINRLRTFKVVQKR